MAAEQPAPTLWERARDYVQNNHDRPEKEKWGGMTIGAHGRLGLAELREVFSPGGNIVQTTPYGMFGHPTPGEVGAGRNGNQGVHGPPAAAQEHDGGSVYGQSLHAGEAPLSPEEIVDRHSQGQGNTDQSHRSPEEIADARTIKPGGFVEKELEREKNRNQNGDDQSNLERGRVLPDEQLDNSKGRGR